MNSRHSKVSLLLSLIGLPLSAGLAHAETRMPTHVACVGDGITAGSGASSTSKNYPSVLQTLFGSAVNVKNFGHSGATMLANGNTPYQQQSEYTAATSFVSSSGSTAIVDVIIMLGTNDSKPVNWTPSGKPKNDQQYLEDYRRMVDHFIALTPKPAVFLALPLATGSQPCCTINGKVIHDEIIPLIKQLASERHLPTIDLNTPTSGHNDWFGDGVHPTDATYAKVAQWMHDGLLQDLSSSGGGAGGTGGAASGGAPSGGMAGSSAGGGIPTGGTPDGSGGGGGVAELGGSAGNGGTASHATDANGGVGGEPLAAASPGGTRSSATATGGGADASVTANDRDSSGCAVSPRGSASSGVILTLLGLAWVGVRRRSERRVY